MCRFRLTQLHRYDIKFSFTSFKKVIVYLKIISMKAYIVSSAIWLDNNFTFKFYNRSIRSNIKTYSTLLKRLNVNLPCRTCVKRRQNMQVLRYLYCSIARGSLSLFSINIRNTVTVMRRSG